MSFDFATKFFKKCFIDFGGCREILMMLCNVFVISLVLKVFEFLNFGDYQVDLVSCMLIVLMVKNYSYENL
jgi:ribose/xylose/arabinose/galactoside ABC-type transport system permease subunit